MYTLHNIFFYSIVIGKIECSLGYTLNKSALIWLFFLLWKIKKHTETSEHFPDNFKWLKEKEKWMTLYKQMKKMWRWNSLKWMIAKVIIKLVEISFALLIDWRRIFTRDKDSSPNFNRERLWRFIQYICFLNGFPFSIIKRVFFGHGKFFFE